MSDMQKTSGGLVVKFQQRHLLDPGPKRIKMSGTCDVCGKASAHGKHACEDHLDRMPYAAGVMARVAQFERETAMLEALGTRATRASKAQALTLSTPLLDQEVSLALTMRTLEAGAVTVERLARMVPHVSCFVTALVLRRLNAQGLASPKGTTKRGSDLWAATPKAILLHVSTTRFSE